MIAEVAGLSFSYGPGAALQDVSFSVSKGDFIGLLGPNGGGKTTLAKILLSLLPLQRGSVRLLGQELKDFNQWAQIGYQQQKNAPAAAVPLTAFEVARMGLLSGKKTPRLFTRADGDKTKAAMQKAGCLDYADKLFYELSGGQQQRALLARTLVNNPKLLILDEPSTALDAAGRADFFALLSRLNKEDNTTIILITHDPAEIGKHINKFLILDKNLIFYGDKKAFCASAEVAKYFGPYAPHLMDHLHTETSCPLGGHSL